MKTIHIKGRTFLVDDEDHERLAGHKWHLHEDGYAERNLPRKDGEQKAISMHREIMGNPVGFQIDHANHDVCDNRKSNLRTATRSQQNANRKTPRHNKSGYKGVHWDRKDKVWRAIIRANNIFISLGRFKDKHEAALAYNRGAIKFHGEFAYLNTVERAGLEGEE